MKNCKGCGTYIGKPRVQFCARCRKVRAAARSRTRVASMTRKQKAEAKLARLRARVASWERKRRIADNAVKRLTRRLKAANRRYNWSAFIGWDKVVPMPRASAEQDAGAVASEQQPSDPLAILKGVRFIHKEGHA